MSEEFNLDATTPYKGGGKEERVFMKGEYEVITRDAVTGEVLQYQADNNIIVDVGRDDVLRLLFAPTGSSYAYLAVGASSTAAAVTDTQLVHELIGNATRIDLTDSAGGSLESSDIQSEVSGSFRKKIVLRGFYDTTDGNNNHPFREFSICALDALPATPFAASGSIFNRFVLASDQPKNSSNTIEILITVRT